MTCTLRHGSSPHARGTHRSPEPSITVARFIPACAGNARSRGRPGVSDPVHPRMRGERRRVSSPCCAPAGSSPHARGTPHTLVAHLVEQRFIPACAGNAPCGARARHETAVHPRMRGERSCWGFRRSTRSGSSPHARGTLEISLEMTARERFIPACAGNALRLISILRARSVHPRMRGERGCMPRSTICAAGSSPHARGTRSPNNKIARERRFIPACAGNALCRRRCRGGCPVHPRMRGERSDPSRAIQEKSGSSPHARGTRASPGSLPICGRFIPACAGNAACKYPDTEMAPVHPRMRGERAAGARRGERQYGSSPHARGTRQCAWICAPGHRFIPACAGNAWPVH